VKLTTNFSLSEFERSETAERNGLRNSVPQTLMPNVRKLAEWLQTLRDRLCEHYGRKVSINISSGYRSPALNRKVGGSSTSVHMSGLAADINASGVSVDDLFAFIKERMTDLPVDQVIHEFGRWVHIGLPGSKGLRKQFLKAIKQNGKTVYVNA